MKNSTAMTAVTAIAILASTLFISSLNAKEMPDLPMIQSRDALRTYAIEQAAKVIAQISTVMPADSGWSNAVVTDKTAAGICATIRGISLKLEVVNPKDRIYTWVNVYNADYDQLFESSKSFELIPAKGGYALPEDFGKTTLEMADAIPIKLNGAQQASICIRNQSGQLIQITSLRVSNGKVYYPRQLAGTNAVLAVYMADTSEDNGFGWGYWNTGTGARVMTEKFVATFNNPTIKGVVTITGTSVNVTVPTTNGVGYNLTAEFKPISKEWVPISFSTSEGRFFKGIWIRKSGEAEWTPYTLPAGAKYIPLPFQQGTYYIIPVWADGDLVEPADPWYQSYGMVGEKS